MFDFEWRKSPPDKPGLWVRERGTEFTAIVFDDDLTEQGGTYKASDLHREGDWWRFVKVRPKPEHVAINAPFIELGFYVGSRPDADTFALLVRFLRGKGAGVAGNVSFIEGPGARLAHFDAIMNTDSKQGTAETFPLDVALDSPDIRVLSLDMLDVFGEDSNVNGIVTYCEIEDVLTPYDKHPIVIWTDGDAFDGFPETDPQATQEAIVRGGRIYRAFVEMCDYLRPDYAAITCEYDLESPIVLRAMVPGSTAFRDCYLSGTRFPSQVMAKAKEIMRGAYVEERASGWYFSTYRFMNPDGIGLPIDDAERRSEAISKLIGSNW